MKISFNRQDRSLNVTVERQVPPAESQNIDMYNVSLSAPQEAEPDFLDAFTLIREKGETLTAQINDKAGFWLTFEEIEQVEKMIEEQLG